MPTLLTLYCRVCAIQLGQYTNVVVEDLTRSYSDELRFVTVTLLPNWDLPSLTIGDKGYLQLEYAIAGQSYYDHNKQEEGIFQYTNYYMKNFIKEKEICKQDKFEF